MDVGQPHGLVTPLQFSKVWALLLSRLSSCLQPLSLRSLAYSGWTGIYTSLMGTYHNTQVWRGLGVSSTRLDKPMIEAMFLKYGMDTTGRLPYDMFVSRLLETPGRRRAQEVRQVGPFVAGGDYRYASVVRGPSTHSSRLGVHWEVTTTPLPHWPRLLTQTPHQPAESRGAHPRRAAH